MLAAVGPKYIMPIGGTYSHIMQYRRIAQEIGYDKRDILLPDDGDILEFVKDQRPRVIQTMELENIMIDGLGIGDVGDIVLRDRKTIATEGIVVIVVPMDTNSGRVTADPDVITRGFIYVKDSQSLIVQVKRVVLESLKLKKAGLSIGIRPEKRGGKM